VSAALMALLVVLLAPAAAQAAAGFSSTTPMGFDRLRHTATVLPNGEVLIAAGQGDLSVTLDSAERFDPASQTWTPAASLAHPRSGATATLLRNGKVLVVGGSSGGLEVETAELYDWVSDTWSPAADMPTPRTDHTATMLRNGKVLVAGGAIGTVPIDTALVYNPTQNTWSPTANTMLARRRSARAAMLPDGRVLVAGGTARNGEGEEEAQASAEIYDPATNSWTATGEMEVARNSFSIAPLPDGRILVAGGYQFNWFDPAPGAEIFDPVSETWSPTATPLINRSESTAIVLSSGLVLQTEWEPMAELFNPATETWSDAGSEVGAHVGMANVRLSDGRVLLTGGCECGPSPVDDASLYTPATKASTTPLDFGDQYVGNRSPVLNVTVQNRGAENLFPTASSISGIGASEFTIVDDQCSGAIVLPGDSCLIGVRLTPSSTGAKSAMLEIEDNEGSGFHTANLDGTGVTPPTGATGPTGPTGETGPTGATGSQGPGGATGATGQQGAGGPTGPTGLTGAQGGAGPSGATGPQGAAGAPGATGAVGPDGKAGAKGDRGDRGDTGAEGREGPAGATAKVTCTSKVKQTKPKVKVQTTCQVTFAKPLARTARVKLKAGGRTVAHGTLRKGRRSLTVTTSGRTEGPYTVTIRR
jgi:N-acetylneuraminic acid mutarotase